MRLRLAASPDAVRPPCYVRSVNLDEIDISDVAFWQAPLHKRLRGLVSAGFTPRQLRRVEDSVQRLAEEIVERVAPEGPCDLVTELAAALPLEIVCEMMGVPKSQYRTGPVDVVVHQRDQAPPCQFTATG